jgi:hypothetical protein
MPVMANLERREAVILVEKPSRGCGEDDVVNVQQEESRTLCVLKNAQ